MNHVYLKQQIERAISHGRLIKMDYVSMSMKVTKNRVIQPMQLKTRPDGEPAVVAHCFLRNDIREFMFEGIQKIELVKPETYGQGGEDYGTTNRN